MIRACSFLNRDSLQGMATILGVKTRLELSGEHTD